MAYSFAFCFCNSQFLQDTLDTLFGILDENSQKYGSKVFDSLVSLHFLNNITKILCLPILTLGKLFQKWPFDNVREFLTYLFLADKEMTSIWFYETVFFLGPHNKFAAG